MLKTTDNNCGALQVYGNHRDNFEKIGNVRIREIKLDESRNLLIFPEGIDLYGDKIGDEFIFSLDNSKLTTGNIMGFVGINGSELKIQSRFSKEDEDYFLHYMLQKVFSINMFDLKHSYSSEKIFDFLLFLFPFYLKKALKHGLFKEYQYKRHDNAHVRGRIDINRHLKHHIPFVGNIAYNTKEFSYDNRISQLARHTIEHIRQHEYGHSILNNDTETQTCVAQIIQATPSYNRANRNMVLNNNVKPVTHTYFYEYRNLQKICRQILRYEGLKYGAGKDKIYGLLFDGAWLWEEYINTVIQSLGFIHPENKTGKYAIYLFEEGLGRRFPDFWKENIVLDAKYKRFSGRPIERIDRNDLHQIISYMHVLQAGIGGFICPSDDIRNCECNLIGNLNGAGGKVQLWNISVPQSAKNYVDFCNQMEIIEQKFRGGIGNL